MFETLSYLPVVLLNQSYESYIEQHLFRPLNMTSSTFAVADIIEGGRLYAQMAQGHMADGRDFTRGKNGTLRAIVPYFSAPGEEKIWAGAGGILTYARDLVRSCFSLIL